MGNLNAMKFQNIVVVGGDTHHGHGEVAGRIETIFE